MTDALQRFLAWWVELSLRRPWWVLGGAGLVGAGLLAVASTLGFKGDFVELLPERTPEVRDLRRVERYAGGVGYLLIQVTGGSRDERRAFSSKAAAALEASTTYVRFVEHHFNTGFFADRGLLLLPVDQLGQLTDELSARIDYEKARANPLFVELDEADPPPTFEALEKKYAGERPRSDYLESRDGSELYLLVKPNGTPAQLDFCRALLAHARSLMDGLTAGTPLHYRLSGAYTIRIEEDDLMQSDLRRAAWLALVLSLGVMFLSTRRLAGLVTVTLPLAVGIGGTFAFAAVTVGHLNPVTGFLGAILIGLGIEYGVHLSHRYWEERAHGRELRPALHEAVEGTFFGALNSAAANGAAFFVLVFADFEAFKQFGRIAAFGVASTLLAAYVMGPAILVLSERFQRAEGPARPPREWLPQGFRPPTWSLWLVVLLVALAVGYSASVVRLVGFENDLKTLKGESPATELEEHIMGELGAIMAPAVAWLPSLDDARRFARLADGVRLRNGEASSIARVSSLWDLLPSDVEARQPSLDRLKQELDQLPRSVREGKLKPRLEQFRRMAEAQPWTAADIPPEFHRRFEPTTGEGAFVLLFPKKPGYDVADLDRWGAELTQVAAEASAAGMDVPVMETNRIAARIFALIRTDGPRVLLLAALVVLVAIWFALRHVGRTLLVAAPLYAGMVCVAGGMHLLGLKLNFLNVVVLPNLLAIAVDNSVHLFHRYQEEGPGSLAHVMRHTGLAALVATLSNAAGYAAILIARHEGLRSVGLLAVVGVASTFVGTTILFPTLLGLLERHKKDGAKAATAAP